MADSLASLLEVGNPSEDEALAFEDRPTLAQLLMATPNLDIANRIAPATASVVRL